MRTKTILLITLLILAIGVLQIYSDTLTGKISIAPIKPMEGQQVTVSALLDLGSHDSKVTIIGGIDGVQISRKELDRRELKRENNVRVKFEWTAVKGKHTAFFSLMPPDGITSITKNIITKSFLVSPRRRTTSTVRGAEVTEVQVPEKPDLIVKKLKIQPENLMALHPVKFVMTIANIGNAPSDLCLGFLKLKGTQYHYTFTIPPLQPKTSRQMHMTKTYDTPMQSTVVLTVDSDGRVDELKEQNNQKSKVMAVYPCKPDLIVRTIDNYPRNLIKRQQFIVRVMVENRGKCTAKNTFLAFWLVKGVTNHQIFHSFPTEQYNLGIELAPGERKSYTYPLTNKYTANIAGRYYAGAKIDYHNANDETSENNNERLINFIVAD